MTPLLPPNPSTITPAPANPHQPGTVAWAREELRLLNLWDTYHRCTDPDRERRKQECQRILAA